MSGPARDPLLAPRNEPVVLLFIVNVAWFFLSHRLELAVAATRRGYIVHVATGVDDPDDAERIRAAGLILHEIPLARGTAGILTDARFAVRVWSLVRRLRPTVVHTVTLKPVVVGGIVARMLRVPGVVNAVPGLGYAFSAGGTIAWLRRHAIEIALAMALRNPRSVAILQNPDDRKFLIDRKLVEPATCELIRGAGVDPAEFCPSQIQDGAAVVSLISRMLREKGVYDFVAAARILAARKVVVKMVLVGATDDAFGSVPRAQLEAWNREGVVTWTGKRTDIPAVIGASTIVCLPTYYKEGVPRVLIEAASCARAIITTDTAGCREIVRHNDNGLLVEPRDPKSLADAIERLVTDPQQCRRMGERGREIVLAEFDVKDVIRRTLEIYDRLAVMGGRNSIAT